MICSKHSEAQAYRLFHWAIDRCYKVPYAGAAVVILDHLVQYHVDDELLREWVLLFFKGKAENRVRRFEDAVESLKAAAQVVESLPSAGHFLHGWFVEIYDLLGRSYYELQRFPDSVRAFESGLRFVSSWECARSYRSWLYRFYLYYARALFHLDSPVPALGALQKSWDAAVAIWDQDSPLRSNLLHFEVGRALLDCGKLEPACDNLARVNPDLLPADQQPAYLQSLMTLTYRREDYRGTVRLFALYDGLISTDSELAAAEYIVALAIRKLGHEAQYCDFLGRCRQHCGDDSMSISRMKRVEKLDQLG